MREWAESRVVVVGYSQRKRTEEEQGSPGRQDEDELTEEEMRVLSELVWSPQSVAAVKQHSPFTTPG